MSEHSYLALAKQQINERIEETRRCGLVGSRRRSRRHGIANSLHSLADRIDI